MPRPQRCRRICREPEYTRFTPEGIGPGEEILLTLDEFEAIRLIDHLGRTHEECARQMEVSRTTVTEIYESARRKIADCLVRGTPLRIAGGKYRLCEGPANPGCIERCHRGTQTPPPNLKGDTIMRIAATYENGSIFQHFGHTEQFKVYDVEDGQVVRAQVLDANGYGHGALAGFLHAFQVDVLICGGIGGGAINALSEAGIDLYPGIDGSADLAVARLLRGELPKRTDVRCSHHDHAHGEGHDCGSHSCGDHGDHGCGSHSCH